MVEFDLHRIYSKNGDGATIGILLSKTRKAKYWMTIERPLFFNGKSNVKRECCIPKDNYFAELFRSNKFQKGYYELQKVKDRDKILIHAGNIVEDLLGCVALGLKIEKNIKIKNKINKPKIFRVYGVDTPESKKQFAKCQKEIQLGLKAKKFTEDFLGDLAFATFQNHPDKYGRILINIRNIKGEDLAQALIKAGLAVEYYGDKKTKNWCKD